MTVSVIRYSKHKESRGENYTIYDRSLIANDFSYDKVSTSHRGVIRGFHGDSYTTKLVSILHGSVKLVTYDLNKHVRQEFIISDSDDEVVTVLIPPNHLNAHQCLSDKCVFFYKWDQPYDLHRQYSVKFDDPEIDPRWVNIKPIVSDRDYHSGDLRELINSLSKF